MKKRYAQVGLGVRAGMFYEAVSKDYADNCELVALCDPNPGRMQLTISKMPEGYPEIKTYAPEDFDRMIEETKPDVVIVTTVDQFHDHYIVRAMELGCDVITEKPMTTTAEKCQRIVDTVQKTGRDVRVTFNYRYAPARSQVKELLMAGTIGKILSVDFHWMLNTRHGADYYRRWHRNKINSGGLLVHKATHHFDLVNWWISSTPEKVFCMGAKKFYGPEMAKLYGFEDHAKRCLDCQYKDRCNFYLDIESKEKLRALYLDNEKYDGYLRDKCVFSEEIDIEDTMNVVVHYRNDAYMSYSLNSFCPWEGYAVTFNGNKGRLEHRMVESVYISGDGTVPGETIEKGSHIHVFPHFAEPYNVPIKKGTGGHGGGDNPLLEGIFSPDPPEDPLNRSAGYADGAYSILTGVAANKSIKTGRPVTINRLVKKLPRPDYPEMKEW